MHNNKPVILIIDNSVAFTGAFKCALQQAELLRDEFDFLFLLPDTSDLVTLVKQKRFVCFTLPMLEIRKQIGAIIGYVPQLLKNAFRLNRIIDNETVDIVIMNDFYNLLGVVEKMLGYKGKLITWVRFLPSAMPKTLRKIWISLAYKYANKVIAMSNAIVHQLPYNKKLSRIYDIVYLLEKYPEKNSDDHGPIELLYLSNYISGKGQDFALAAFQAAYRENPQLRLTFAGGDMGLKKNKKFKEALETEVKKANLSEVVQFLPFENDIEKLIKQADIVLNFSESESFSMTCVEAGYFGLPVIATRCGGPEEIIMNEQTGLLIENRDISQMTKAILQLASSRELQRQYGKAARAYVRDKFNYEIFTRELKSLIESLLTGAPVHGQ